MSVEGFLGDALERAERVDSGVVHQNVYVAVSLLCFGEEAGDIGLLGDVALYGDGFAAFAGDVGDDFVRACLAGGIVDDYGGAFGGERLGYRCADAFRGAGYDGYLVF